MGKGIKCIMTVNNWNNFGIKKKQVKEGAAKTKKMIIYIINNE